MPVTEQEAAPRTKRLQLSRHTHIINIGFDLLFNAAPSYFRVPPITGAEVDDQTGEWTALAAGRRARG
jgi:hypothetical protein